MNKMVFARFQIVSKKNNKYIYLYDGIYTKTRVLMRKIRNYAFLFFYVVKIGV